ncbi:GGDEF domain-containing protein [Stakelama tenebrarum]|uniref:Diguanylate cyclase n=1 Tax=Stakelama tenebrarum TaxID=2711215 RepID=A0A6G6Y6M3_9SPHN|nr:GGDEF domain-containing protein [Sphingosinithalassobacter tenebrarum]QIG80447.1 diguanylate cyclase [Sphingosinithalassobacter tenebrarum]
MYEPAVPQPTPVRTLATVRSSAECRFEATFHNAPIGIAHVAPNGDFLAVNDQFAKITGHSREALLKHGFPQITHPDDLGTDLDNVEALLTGERDRYCMAKRYVRPDGDVVWVNLTVALMRDEEGQPDYFISVIEDISEVRRARTEATRDPLTGLLNRRGLADRLRETRLGAFRDEAPFALVYLDLDRFKQVNDALGHARGDACLKAATEALGGLLRAGDLFARIGGDEFLLILQDCGPDAAVQRVAHFEAAIESIQVSPGWQMGGSFGFVTVRPDDPRSDSQLIDAADIAMFAVKRARCAGR